MKKTIISLAVVASVAFFASVASATGEVTCMGACNPTPGGHHHHNWNKPDMSYKLNSNFNGDLNGGSLTHGTGDGPKTSQSYVLGEQEFKQTGKVDMTDFLAGTACNATCDQNNAQLGFEGSQTLKTGGMQESNGSDHSGAYVGSSVNGNFGANAKLNWD